MKKNKSIILLAVLTLLFTGCMKYNVNMGIGEDKKVTFEAIYAIDTSSMQGMMGGDESTDDEFADDEFADDEFADDEFADDEFADDEIVDDEWVDDGMEEDSESSDGMDVEDYKFLESKGYKVEEYKEKTDNGELVGVKVTKTFTNIDDITKETEKKIDFATFFEEETFDDSQLFSKNGSTYKATFAFDFSEDAEEGMDYSQYESYFDIEYKITLPSKAISNNATKVSDDGKTLTWDLKYGALNEVNFEFSFDKGGNSLMIIIIAAVAGVAVIGLVIFFVMKGKKKNTTPPTATPETPVAPVAPVAPTAPEATNVVPTTPTAPQTVEATPEPVVIPQEPAVVEPVAVEATPVAPAPTVVEETKAEEALVITSETPQTVEVTPEVVVEAAVPAETLETAPAAETVVETLETTPVVEPVVEPTIPTETLETATTPVAETQTTEQPQTPETL